MTIRVWADIDQDTLTEAEKRLIAACKTGEACVLADGARPDALADGQLPDGARHISADILRYLILGGCAACAVDGFGVQLAGAYVTGPLSLDFATAQGQTVLANCRFDTEISALQTRFEALNLSGSFVPGLFAQGIQVAGGVFLNGAFHATGEVSLAGARVTGQLSCIKGRFENAGGHALNAQGIEVAGHVFLNGAFHATGEVRLADARVTGQLSCIKGQFDNAGGDALNAQGIEVAGDVFLSDAFHATGEVSLAGARVGGQLACINGRFDNAAGKALNAQSIAVAGGVLLRDAFHATGEVSLSGARITGQLSCSNGQFENEGGHAFIAQRMHATAEFVWKGVKVDKGYVSLASAHVGDLVDDLQSWPKGERLFLDGFTYDRISGAFTTPANRLEWLARGTVWKGAFYPQPYTQLAKVLREMGHEAGARKILLRREERLAKIARKDHLTPFPALWSGFERWVVGYGHAPGRAVLWALAALFLATPLYFIAYRVGAMVPNSPIILTSPAWAHALAAQPDTPTLLWQDTAIAKHYETFNAFAYAADVFVPIINFGQETAWAASTATTFGTVMWAGAWVLKTLGWLISALGAAAITGIMQRK